MAGPFDFGGGFSFGDPMGGNPFLPQPAVPRPQMSPQEEEALLGRLMEGGLGGLAYVGKVLDKSFGGRAVRGVLGGNPRELLSALPFSDTLGITNEADTVSGHQLLQNAGVIDPGDDSFLGTALGIGAEIGLDPGSYVGAAVPKLLARGGKALGRTAGAGLEAAAGVNPYTYAARQVERAKAPVRALFDTDAAGAWTPGVQRLASEVYTPELRAGQSGAAMNAADANVRLRDYAKRVPEPQANEFNWALTQQAEGMGTDALNKLNQLGFTPGEAQDILGIGDQLGTRVRSLAGQERGLGLQSKVLEDLPEWQRVANEEALANGLPAPHSPQAQYAPRTLANFDEASDFSRRASDRLAGGSEFQTSRDDFLRGIPGGTAKLDEFARDPRLSGSQRTLSDADAEQLLASHILGQPAGAIPLNHPVYDQAKELSGFLKSMRPEVQQTGLFNPDLVGNVAAREMDSARRLAGAKTTLAAMDPARGFVKPVADLEAAGQRYVRVPDLLNAHGLSHVDANGTPVAAETVAKLLGIDLTQPGALQQLKDFAIPADAAADLQRVGQAWQTPAVVKPVVDMYDKFTSIFKSNLTSPFPGFHFRNLMSGIFNMWRDGAASPAAGDDMLKLLRGGSLSETAAAKLYPGMPAGQASNEFLKELLGNKIAFVRGGQTAEQMGPRAALSGGMLAKDVPEVGGAIRPLGEDLRGFAQSVTPERGKLGQQLNPLNPEEFLPVQAGQKLGNTVEDWIRGTHYLAKRLEGLDPAAAKLQTMKYQIDYGDLTQFEKNVMKRLFPWYTFSRKNLPPILEDLAQDPAKLAATARVTTGSREKGEFVPNYVAEGAATPIPGAPDGFKRFISSFGLPLEDEGVKTLGAIAQGDPKRTFQQLFGMAQPFVKLPAEIATGTQMYSGRKLEDLRPYEFTQLGGLLPEDVARKVSQVAANTPASRALSTVDKLIDERKGLGTTALNTLTGVRVTDVDLEKSKDQAAMQLLRDRLKGEPGVRSREEVYVPKDKLPALGSDDLMLYSLLQDLERRQAAKAREAKRLSSSP